ncbi:uncharacterized protein BXZ73DRAFT_97176 [Epithele typhae]|uniref:uncharacterized protein n=1 Tax=Epithele typhae TaxID=378194 RepID=UPI0020087B3E|nr:uncharacterized protein BXZ73DRAFT_97176 [Epithele typhae]KAH9943121.1 hypothetical protein BXZ73DRAFT_97176 [Epithele typhae]
MSAAGASPLPPESSDSVSATPLPLPPTTPLRMAHHYPPHTQAQTQTQPQATQAVASGFPAFPAGSYPYGTGFYHNYPAGYTFDSGAHTQPPTAPEIPGVTAQLASHALGRLISTEMRDAGFESAELRAVRRLELEVAALVQQLYERAHEYANLANRAKPVVTDVLCASDDFNLEAVEIYRLSKKSRKRKRNGSMRLLPPAKRSPSPELLSSDDEGTPSTGPMTLRPLPHYVPPLPPKHTYLRTPISPPKKAAIPSLEKKLQNASLVQDSLKNLLLATEDSATEDAELLGATVNWESTTHPRKRWRLS